MRKSSILVFASLLLPMTACMEHNPDIAINNQPDPEIQVSLSAVQPYEEDSYLLEAKDGYVAYAIMDGDTLASATETREILVPKKLYSTQGRAIDGVVTVYEAIDPSTSQQVVANNTFDYGLLLFEDTPNGDHDYNDLVMHFNQVISGNKLALRMQPVAMGNTLKLGFGADLYLCDNQKRVIRACRVYYSRNVKLDFFKESDSRAMINTEPGNNPQAGCLEGYKELIGVKPIEISSLDDRDVQYTQIDYEAAKSGSCFFLQNISPYKLYCNWFITDPNGNRFYAAPSYYTGEENWTDTKGYPMGIYTHAIRTQGFKNASNQDIGGRDWIDYPLEGVSILKAYNGFAEWLQGTGKLPDWQNPNAGTCVDAMGNYYGASDYHHHSLYNSNLWIK